MDVGACSVKTPLATCMIISEGRLTKFVVVALADTEQVWDCVGTSYSSEVLFVVRVGASTPTSGPDSIGDLSTRTLVGLWPGRQLV